MTIKVADLLQGCQHSGHNTSTVQLALALCIVALQDPAEAGDVLGVQHLLGENP